MTTNLGKQVEPSTPPEGSVSLYVDIADGVLKQKDDDGVVSELANAGVPVVRGPFTFAFDDAGLESGIAFYTGNLFPAWKGSLFIGGHQTNDLVRLSLDGETITSEERLLVDRTPRLRIRDVRQGPDGALYLLTDEPLTGKLLKLVPKK